VANKLYYGDNLEVLREHVADESIDLIYLDPPFNSNAGYNVLFKSASGAGADASIEAFDDTWTWGDSAKEALLDIAKGTNRELQVMMSAMHDALQDSPLMAYLAMMAVRLVELHRVLKDSGSLYLHCDPTASHYLKLVLDAVFGPENFRNEIIWRRTNAHNKLSKQFGPIHDTIFFYSKSPDFVFHPGRRPFSKSYVAGSFPYEDANGRYQSNVLTGAEIRTGDSGKPWRTYDPTPKGRHWALPRNLLLELPEEQRVGSSQELLDRLDKRGLVLHPAKPGSLPRYKQYLHRNDGVLHQDIWAYQPGTKGTLEGTDEGIDQDVKWLDSVEEKLGYPTQKPRALLERIIAASSNPGDTVLDPFCGCGTAVDAAQKLGRQWIGIDVTHIAIGMIEDRMRSGYPGIAFETHGVPKDIDSALRLATDDKHQFQQWACWHVGGYPREKKGGDKGVDGWFNYLAEGGKIETGVISVKGGENLNPGMVRDLGRVMERDHHRFGLFITAAMPTKGVRDEIASHPLIETEFGRFPAMQVVTIAELIHGPKPKLPPLISPVKRAARVETRASHQKGAQGELL
jgi:site-specific DNA-methyltransferase (adenine-specific)